MGKVPVRIEDTIESRAARLAEEAVGQEDNPAEVTAEEQDRGNEDLALWRDRALRLQAEMANYRKRQKSLADRQISANHERVLQALLGIADDLRRALNAHEADAASLRQGVAMTYRNLRQTLDREGLQEIKAQGHVFDPTWHEAVGTVSHQDAGVKPQTVVEVMEEGYRLGDRVVRPARVVVAV